MNEQYRVLGDRYRHGSPGKFVDKLPVGTYVIRHDEFGYFVEQIEDFDLPPKLYGNAVNVSERILTTFSDKVGENMGVLLSGEKGSGKTLLAKKLSIELREQGFVTLILNAAHSGEKFFQFLRKIDQPTVILIDEFEKVYKDNQEGLLTLLHGTVSGHRLFVLTCNDMFRVSEFIINRPGRVYYHIKYDGLKDDFVREYCEDKLNNQDEVEAVVQLANIFAPFNFDMLQTLVEEMNRYSMGVKDALEILNVRPEGYFRNKYDFSIWYKDEKMEQFKEKYFYVGNPFGGDFHHWDTAYLDIEVDKEGEESYPFFTEHQREALGVAFGTNNIGIYSRHLEFKVTSDNLQDIDMETGDIVFHTPHDDITMRLSKCEEPARGKYVY